MLTANIVRWLPASHIQSKCISKAVIQRLTFFIEIYSVFSGVLRMASIQIQCSSAFRSIHISQLELKETNDTMEKKTRYGKRQTKK